MDLLTQAIVFADEHPLFVWLVTTAALNAAVRSWPWLSQTIPGRLFAAICGYLGADALGLLKAGAAASGAKALHVAAGAAPTSPPPSAAPAPVAIDAAPPTPRTDDRPAPGEGGRRS